MRRLITKVSTDQRSPGRWNGCDALVIADRPPKFYGGAGLRRIGFLAFLTAGLVIPRQAAVGEAPTTPDRQQSPTESIDSKHDVASELSFTGTVIDEKTRNPVQGANVFISRALRKSGIRRIIEETSHLTDANGKYRFVIPPEQASEDSLRIAMEIEHPDYVRVRPQWHRYTIDELRKKNERIERPFDFKLPPSEAITGRIVDQDGKPVSNTPMLSYSVRKNEKTGKEESSGSFMKTSTGSEGRFRIQLEKGAHGVFWIMPAKFSPIQIVTDTKRGEWGDITVKPGISATGKVVSETGKPVAGVWVNLVDRNADREVPMMAAPSSMRRCARTSEDGTFKLRPVKPGYYSIGVSEWERELSNGRRGPRTPAKIDHIFIDQTIKIRDDFDTLPFTIQARPHIKFEAQYVDTRGVPLPGRGIEVSFHFERTMYRKSLRADQKGKIVGKLPKGLTKAKLTAFFDKREVAQIRLKKDGPLYVPRELYLGTLNNDVTGVEIVLDTAPLEKSEHSQ